MTVPVVVLLEVLLLLAAPLLVLVAALVSVGAHSTRPVRSTALVVVYAAIELSTLGRLLAGVRDPDTLLREILNRAYQAMHRILDVHLALEADSATREQLARSAGLVVLARHCGPGDSLFIAWLLAVRYHLRLHVVLKSVLRLEPSLDLAGDQLPLCFVGRRRHRACGRIRALAASMSTGDALLLFPEGGNFSATRWREALSSLAASGAHERARRARRQTFTLPPHLGGAMAALTGAPDADVLLLAHSGFASDGRDRPWWRLPVHRTLAVHTVFSPAATVPRDHGALATWLDDAWSQIDTWVQEHVENQDSTGR